MATQIALDLNVPAGADTPAPLSDLVGNARALRDVNLSWKERDLPQVLRTKHVHGLHPYLGKFPPQIVEIVLRLYFKRGALIVDPFAGSGTTLVESLAHGCDTFGADVSGFNCLLVRAKCERYEVPSLAAEARQALRKALAAYEAVSDANAQGHPYTESEYLNRWFLPSALGPLLSYHRAINRLEYHDFLSIVLSRAARSARNVAHFDLDHPSKPVAGPYYCAKHRRTCLPVTDSTKFLVRYTEDSVRRVAEFQTHRTDRKWTIAHGDSRSVQFPSGIDGVITSPPYVGLIDYHEQHRYAYELLGMHDRAEMEIGPLSDGQSKRAKAAYCDGIADVFAHLRRSLTRAARLFVVVNDKFELYSDILKRSGYVVEEVVKRKVDRRTGRRSTAFDESIFIARRSPPRLR